MRQGLRKALAAACGAAAISMVFASTARAGCSDVPTISLHGAHVAPIAYAIGSQADASSTRGFGDPNAIVGLWQFTFTSEGNTALGLDDGSILDAGYTVWHSDGTEIMNSSRDPATSSFCLGAWTLVGQGTYNLNHVTLSWDNTGRFCTPTAPATSCMVGPGSIHETVTVSRSGNSYSGHVTIDQYDNTPSHKHMFRLTGTISAQRIQAN